MKKFIVMMGLLTGITSFATVGLNLPFTSDGKLHEEKLINRNIHSEDTDIVIKKVGNGKYEITHFFSDAESENETEWNQTEVSKATLKKNVICDEYSCIGYDTKLKKAVFLDKKDMRIIYPEW